MCLHAVFQLPFLFQKLYVFINAFVCARVCSLTMFFILSSSLLFSQHCLSSHRIMQICESSQLVQYFPLWLFKNYFSSLSSAFVLLVLLPGTGGGWVGRWLCCCWVLLPAEISIDCRPWESVVEQHWQTVSAFKTKVHLADSHITSVCVCTLPADIKRILNWAYSCDTLIYTF